MKSSIIDLEVRLIHETPKAYLVTVDGEKKIWVPKSLCELEHKKGALYTLTLEESLATEKELI